jgi:hypothetical protein
VRHASAVALHRLSDLLDQIRLKGGIKERKLVVGVNYFFRWRLSFLPVLSLHHWSTIAQSDAKSVRSSVSEFF